MDEKRPDAAPEQPSQESPEDSPKTPRRIRIFALLGALFMIALTLLYTYALATGKIFW